MSVTSNVLNKSDRLQVTFISRDYVEGDFVGGYFDRTTLSADT